MKTRGLVMIVRCTSGYVEKLVKGHHKTYQLVLPCIQLACSTVAVTTCDMLGVVQFHTPLSRHQPHPPSETDGAAMGSPTTRRSTAPQVQKAFPRQCPERQSNQTHTQLARSTTITYHVCSAAPPSFAKWCAPHRIRAKKTTHTLELHCYHSQSYFTV